jgi:2-polyprenyl-6-methoxyphenol hydroxylase-like FAD-dependent oxidoreductase
MILIFVDRGEAANHGLLDAFQLVHVLDRIYNHKTTPKQGLGDYEANMRKRARRAVQLSRQACLDAHAWDQLNENSAILTKRAIEGE